MQETTILAPLDHIPAEVCCAQDYESLAERFIAKDRFNYIANGSGKDLSLRRNRSAFEQLALQPRLLQDMSTSKTDIKFAEADLSVPFMLAPVAYQKLVHPDGELATAHAADAMGIGLISSTLASVKLEETAPSEPGAIRWFQLYAQDSEEATLHLLQRALLSGYQAIMLTLDTPLQAPSHQTLRSGFQMPKELQPVNLSDYPNNGVQSAGAAGIFQQHVQKAVSLELLKKIIAISHVPVWAKGIMSTEDATYLKDLGIARIVVSNHGGRALDGVPASLTVLPDIRQALGDDYPILFDSGIRSGADIFKAIALGADAVLIGRLQVYALSIAGALDVAHLIKLLKEELEYTMAMTGCRTIQEIRHANLRKLGTPLC